METTEMPPMAPGVDVFRFLDLAPELRNAIYLLLFDREEKIYMSCMEDKMFRLVPGASLNPSILRVNRQIWAEATPILYAINTFRFYSPRDLLTFLLLIGSSKKHVRYLCAKVDDASGSVVTRTCHLLKEATSLERFTFRPKSGTLTQDQCGPKLKLMIPWLKIRRSQILERGDTRDALDVLHFEVQPHDLFTSTRDLEDEQGERVAVWKEVLRRAMG